MRYCEYPELSDDQQTAIEQVERAAEIIREQGASRAFQMATRGEITADAIEVAMGHIESEIDMLRESPEYTEAQE